MLDRIERRLRCWMRTRRSFFSLFAGSSIEPTAEQM